MKPFLLPSIAVVLCALLLLQAIDDVQKATAEVQEAAESVDQALNSVKTVTGTTSSSENQ
ncbi:MAG: hypothetical protein UW70_C0042G0003 [Candidatus Peregrinibacteria bacterium GW2011_GWA2_44_7]|nr:MAG: hypothetical protein UW70_C0042G0003 [Candidatus Peregrinibacteria bacterium GW2011_GWA2_44_7]